MQDFLEESKMAYIDHEGNLSAKVLRRSLVTEFVRYLSDEASNGNLSEALDDLAKIEDYIIGETE